MRRLFCILALVFALAASASAQEIGAEITGAGGATSGGTLSGLTTNAVLKATSSTTAGDSLASDDATTFLYAGTNIKVGTSGFRFKNSSGTAQVRNSGDTAFAPLSSSTHLLNGSSSGVLTFAAAATTTDYTLTWPAVVSATSNNVIVWTTGGLGSWATGTPSASTYMRGDGSWAAVSSGIAGLTTGTLPKAASSTSLDDSILAQTSTTSIDLSSGAQYRISTDVGLKRTGAGILGVTNGSSGNGALYTGLAYQQDSGTTAFWGNVTAIAGNLASNYALKQDTAGATTLNSNGAQALVFRNGNGTANLVISGTSIWPEGDATTNIGQTAQRFYTGFIMHVVATRSVNGSVSGTTAWNVVNEQYFEWTLAGNLTISGVSNQKAGATYTLALIQDATGSRTFTAPSTMKFAGGGSPTLTITAAHRDIFTFYSDGTNLWEISRAMNVF